MAGMGTRVAERLDAMRQAREQSTWAVMARTGRALVLQTRREIAEQKFGQYSAARGLRLGQAGKSSYYDRGGAAAAGRAAGDRVGLSSGNIGGGVKAIGKG
jgi:hypothetical protein